MAIDVTDFRDDPLDVRVTAWARVEGMYSQWELVPFVAPIPVGAFMLRRGSETKEWYAEYWGTEYANKAFAEELDGIHKLIHASAVGDSQDNHPHTLYFVPVPFDYGKSAGRK